MTHQHLMPSIRHFAKQEPPALYENLLHHFFLSNDGINGEALPYNSHLSKDFFSACAEKDTNLPIWNSLIDELKQFPDISHVRDMPNDEQHCYKAQLCLHPDREQAINVYVSFLGNLVGFTYAENHTNPEKGIICDSQSGKPIEDISYLPITGKHETIKEQILATTMGYFPGFIEFDNTYAGMNVENIKTFGRHFTNIQIFQILFTSNMHFIL